MRHVREKMQFPCFQFRKAVQKHYGEVGKYSIFWLLTSSVIFLPNIMKIRQCFRELCTRNIGDVFWDTVYVACAGCSVFRAVFLDVSRAPENSVNWSCISYQFWGRLITAAGESPRKRPGENVVSLHKNQLKRLN